MDMELVHRVVYVLTFQLSPVFTAPTHGGNGQAEKIWVAGYTQIWFTRLQMVTHLSANRPGIENFVDWDQYVTNKPSSAATVKAGTGEWK